MQKIKNTTYLSPEVETMEMTATQMICGSNDGTTEQYQESEWNF